jgi:hypothetical protein
MLFLPCLECIKHIGGRREGKGGREGKGSDSLERAEDVLDLVVPLLELGAHGHGHSLAMAGWIPLHPVSGGSQRWLFLCLLCWVTFTGSWSQEGVFKKMYLGGCKLSQNLTFVHPAIFATLRMSLDCEQKRRNWATPKYQLQNVLIPSYKGIVFPSTFVRVENPSILQERIGASRGLAAF